MFIDYPLAAILAVAVLLMTLVMLICIYYVADGQDHIKELEEKLYQEKRWSDYLELKAEAERSYKVQFMNNLRETEEDSKEERKDA